ncbi:N-acetylmuramoyl-L-alanine amidase [Fundidesulfovibrio agrisoli]|uniref:N-acetylmuramoyl-L-alanine amidase n=1 Tax=Fundidesulfovibrio agrisoli TaxID=2922717 RepID=UPI001FAD840F
MIRPAALAARPLLLALFLAALGLCLCAGLGSGSALAASAPDAAKASGQAKSAKSAKADTSTTSAKTPKDGQVGKAGKEAKPAKLTPVTDVQIWSGKDYSRIAVVLAGEVQHHWQLLPPEASKDGLRRLYVDLDDTRIKPGVPGRFDVRGDVARKVRLAPYKPGVTRLVVEVENLKNQQVFVLENPYRIIVDVQGQSAKARAAEDKADKDKAASGKSAEPQAQPKGKGKTQAAPEAAAQEAAPAETAPLLATPGRKKMARQLVEQLGLTVRRVMVDAGHGGKDPGAHGAGGLVEKDVNLRIARLLGEKLEKMGFEVLYTRTQDKFVSLEGRTAMANARKADLFVSVHCNAHGDPGSSGLETYSLNLASTPDEVRVAARENSVDPRRISDMQKILDELMHASKLTESRDFARAAHASALNQAKRGGSARDRGVHEAPFYVLLGAKMPAILVEVGYITNPAEAAHLRNEKYLDGLAQGLAEGVRAYKQKIERFGG